ncbi:MAG: DUF2807 domain-containing protein [Cellvibrio sp.]
MNVKSKLYIAFFTALLTVNSSADEIVAKSYDIKNIDSVVVTGAGRMDLVQGDSESLRVEAEKEIMERVVVDQSGSKLTLSVKNFGKGFSFFHWFDNNNGEVKYILQVKNIKFIGASGASHVKTGNLTGKSLDLDASGASEIIFANLALEGFFVELSGASNLRFQQLNTEKAKFKLSGAANVDVKENSQAEFLKIGASGASNFRGKLFKVQKAEVGASGASNIDVYATEFLKADASGASNVKYLGSPKTDIDSSGASHINAVKH